MAETQNDPLLPGYSFNAHLVTGLTPIDADGYLDFFIDRPLGMKGFILNLTIRGEGVINNQDEQFVCRPGDILLFPPGEIHHYGRHPDARELAADGGVHRTRHDPRASCPGAERRMEVMSLLLFIGVTIFCHQAGMFDAGGGGGFVAGLDSLFATIVYLICWAVPSLLAWAVWATWWR